MKRLFYILNIIISILLFMSCKDEMDEYGDDRPSRWDALGMKFNVSDDGFEIPTTRAAKANFSKNEQVGVLSMKENGKGGWENVFDTEALVITNVNDPEGKWYYAGKKQWKNNSEYRFRAFFPVTFNSSDNSSEKCANGFEWTDFSGDGSTRLMLNNYKSATNPRLNTDLMVSDTVKRKNNTNLVKLTMRHLLANVNFKFKSTVGKKLTVTKFTVNGYVGDGSCTCEVNQAGKWNIKWDIKSKNVTINNSETIRIWTDKTYDDQSKVSFVNTSTNQIMTAEEMLNSFSNWSGYNSYNGAFYAVPQGVHPSSVSLCSFNRIITSDDATNGYGHGNLIGLLFIPQELKSEDKKFDLTMQEWYHNWYNGEDHPGNSTTKTMTGIPFKCSTYAEIEYYFDDNKNEKWITAVDLNVKQNGQNFVWEAGKKYIYNLGVYDYKIEVDNVYVEGWEEHSYEEDL